MAPSVSQSRDMRVEAVCQLYGLRKAGIVTANLDAGQPHQAGTEEVTTFVNQWWLRIVLCHSPRT